MVLVNPGQAALWRSHVLLNGRAKDYHVANFAGPMSIKSVLRGTAAWHTSEGTFEVRPGSCLIINDRQPYSITVESRSQVETFCVFFAAGFVEDIQRVRASPDRRLLDNPTDSRPFEFQERLRINDSVLTPLLHRLYRTSNQRDVLQLAETLVALHQGTVQLASKLEAAKLETREELLRRVCRGRNVIEGSLFQRLSLENVAREAALSPYHFHRSFTRLFGVTPYCYQSRRRIERAAELLKHSAMPVTEICFVCGYQSPGSFSALFRRIMGVTPSQFRNR